VFAVTGGRPPFSRIENLLADIWVVLIRANSEKGSLPEEFDHPVRAEMAAKAKASAKSDLMARFEKLKRKYQRGGE